MNELDRDQFPKECWGCYEYCCKCTRKIGSVSVPAIRELAAARKLKSQAVARMQREIDRIDEQLELLLAK